MTFVEMFKIVRNEAKITRSDFARDLGISKQYFCDLEHGRRMPSVALVNKICALGRDSRGRLEWHIAGAQAHGWEVASPAAPDKDR
jgi:DNA-binding XRE family transcriptional regulator